MKEEMAKSLETNIEKSELLLISSCLDPRFKDNFFPVKLKGWLGNMLPWTLTLKLSYKVRNPVLSLLLILQLTIHYQVKFESVLQKFCRTVELSQILMEEQRPTEPLIEYKTGLDGITTSCVILFWIN